MWSSEAVREWGLDLRLERKDRCLEAGLRRQVSHEGKAEACSIRDCFRLLEETEILEEENQWYCAKCQAFVDARKSLQLYRLPPVLVICLKRFKSNGRLFLSKNDAVVAFEARGFSLEEFVIGRESRGAVYDLVAVSNHMGGLGGGHYTATCLAEGGWTLFDDSQHRPLGGSPAPDSHSYILVYQRRES